MKLKTKTCHARPTFVIVVFGRLTSRLTFRKWIVFVFVRRGASWEMEKE